MPYVEVYLGADLVEAEVVPPSVALTLVAAAPHETSAIALVKLWSHVLHAVSPPVSSQHGRRVSASAVESPRTPTSAYASLTSLIAEAAPSALASAAETSA